MQATFKKLDLCTFVSGSQTRQRKWQEESDRRLKNRAYKRQHDKKNAKWADVSDLAKTMEVMLVPDCELDRRRRAAKSLAGYAQEHYHRVDTSEFRTAIVVEAVRQGRNRGLTDDEARLWPDDHEKALRVRGIISRFDELPGAKGQKGRLDSGLLVEFIKWCGVKKDMEKNLYETYFCATYSGQLKLPAWNTVYKARKEREESGITDEEERRAFEKILAA